MTEKVIKIIRESIANIHRELINSDDVNCYMYALNMDMNVYDISQMGKFSIGSVSDTYKDNMSLKDMIESLYKDMEVLGMNINKYNNDSLLDDEWLIALFISEEANDFHFLRTYPKNDVRPYTWYHKKGFNGKVTHTDSSCKDITDPKTADMRLYVCRYLTIPYNYVDTFKISLKKDF